MSQLRPPSCLPTIELVSTRPALGGFKFQESESEHFIGEVYLNSEQDITESTSYPIAYNLDLF